MNLELWVDVVGWTGSLEVVLAFALINSRRITSNSVIYQWLNLTGGIFLIINTIYYGSYPSTFINLVWVVIALYGLGRIWGKRFAK